MFTWSIDVWSLGIIILELMIGFPIYMSYKGRVAKVDKNKIIYSGL